MVALWLSLVGGGATAETIVPVKLTTQDKADIARVEHHLNEIKTLQAEFLQFSSNGGSKSGRAYLSRPGKMRFEYDPPTPILIVSSGLILTYYDRELEQVTETLLNTTPVAFLVRDKVKLAGDVMITKIQRGHGVLRITVAETDNPEEGSIKLVFTERPMALRQWVIADPQGVDTTITLFNVRTGVKLDKNLFVFVPPKEVDDFN